MVLSCQSAATGKAIQSIRLLCTVSTGRTGKASGVRCGGVAFVVGATHFYSGDNNNNNNSGGAEFALHTLASDCRRVNGFADANTVGAIGADAVASRAAARSGFRVAAIGQRQLCCCGRRTQNSAELPEATAPNASERALPVPTRRSLLGCGRNSDGRGGASGRCNVPRPIWARLRERANERTNDGSTSSCGDARSAPAQQWQLRRRRRLQERTQPLACRANCSVCAALKVQRLC